jgi:nitrate reductase NapE component
MKKAGGECRMKKNEWRDKAKKNISDLNKYRKEKIDIILNMFLFKILLIGSVGINLFCLWRFVI